MADLRFAAVELQISELTVAHTLLDHAATWDDERARLARRGARRIYRSVVRFLAHLHPTPEQQSRIDKRLGSLKRKLKLGPRCPDERSTIN